LGKASRQIFLLRKDLQMPIDPRSLLREAGVLGDAVITLAGRFRAAARRLVSIIPRRRAEALALLSATALVLGGSVDGLSYILDHPSVAPSKGVFEIRGISYPSFHNGTYATAESTAALAELAKTGANYVAIIPTRFSRTIKDSEFSATDGTESDEHVLKAISDAHALGLAVLLKPHVDPSDGKPRGAYDPTDVGEWFANYEAFLLHYAAMAAAAHVEMFSIGCELDSMVGPRYRSQWLNIIHSVRQVYHGPLTYAHDWPGVSDVGFWDAVDYIGTDAYDPLSDARNPSVADLAAGWTTISSNPWVAKQSNYNSPLRNYHALWLRYHKPVIFTEIGYKSVTAAATRPGDWKWDSAVDLQLQARAYEAFFQVWSRQSAWMKGAFFWNWEPIVHPERTAYGLKGYTPQNKPAELVIAHWYHRMHGTSVAGVPPPSH
jgi:hypothetical protein